MFLQKHDCILRKRRDRERLCSSLGKFPTDGGHRPGAKLMEKNIICLIIIVCSSKFTYSSENWGGHWAILNDALMIAQLKNSHQGAILRWAILKVGNPKVGNPGGNYQW